MRVEAFARTDPGPVRETNEDYFFIDEENGLFLLADGMGGHNAGEVAAQLAVETVRDVLLGECDPDETRLAHSLDDDVDELRERLRYAMNRASFHIRDESRRNAEWAGMGTTLVACMIEEGMANLAHVGDSRIYLFRDGRLQRLTRDHTVVQQELDAGRLTPELARVVPHKNVLTQSIGFHGPVEPDSATRAVDDGDLFVLVSDGVSDPLPDDTLEELCGEHGPAELAEVLVTSALEAGGEDNITCVVVHVIEA